MGNRPTAGLALALGLALAAQLPAQSRFTKQDGDRFQTKLQRINAFANARPKTAATKSGNASQGSVSQTTQLSDVELNSYLRFNLKDEVPAGIVEPTLSSLGNGQVKGSAVIDLDAVRKQRQRGWTDPLGTSGVSCR